MARVAVLLKGLRCVHAIYHYHAERPMVYRPDQALLTVWLLYGYLVDKWISKPSKLQ